MNCNERVWVCAGKVGGAAACGMPRVWACVCGGPGQLDGDGDAGGERGGWKGGRKSGRVGRRGRRGAERR
jgi:hypothetical protein